MAVASGRACTCECEYACTCASASSNAGIGSKEGAKLHVAIIVLGDLGRSPRMQYHAVSLLEEGHHVSLIGYDGSPLVPRLRNDGSGRLNVILLNIPSPEIFKKALPVYLIWRISSLCVYLLYALFVRLSKATKMMNKPVDCLLVQNPPAMPLLAIAYFFCVLTGTPLFKTHRPALVIDWHNLGYTMLPNPIFSMIARLYEKIMAPLADSHLCVTAAMREFIIESFAVPQNTAHVLCDCPPDIFQPISIETQHRLLSKLHGKITIGCPPAWYLNLDPLKQTMFTQQNSDGTIVSRPGRPAFLVSSTSWTPDEDFGILLDALVALDGKISKRQSKLKIVCLVTGKGPQKIFYQQKISKIKFENVAIQTLWLEPEDYPQLLACTDLGISLHLSTSGIDLPMKILDLFGCQVPVCAKNFACLGELVKDDENGRIFDTTDELTEHLWYLLRPLGESPDSKSIQPHSFGELARYSGALDGRTRWRENWKHNALPVLIGACSKFKQ